MAVEVFTYPEEHTRLFADVIRAGMHVMGRIIPEDVMDALQEKTDEMYAYAKQMEEPDDDDDDYEPECGFDFDHDQVYDGDVWRCRACGAEGVIDD